jgi:hypothetical protein
VYQDDRKALCTLTNTAVKEVWFINKSNNEPWFLQTQTSTVTLVQKQIKNLMLDYIHTNPRPNLALHVFMSASFEVFSIKYSKILEYDAASVVPLNTYPVKQHHNQKTKILVYLC